MCSQRARLTAAGSRLRYRSPHCHDSAPRSTWQHTNRRYGRQSGCLGDQRGSRCTGRSACCQLQVIASPVGEILWDSGALPGAVHELTAARIWGIARELAAQG
jgi:hypothetical protein